MMKRPGLAPMRTALELWKIYNRKLLTYAETQNMPLVCFDWPQSDYLNAVGDIAFSLGLDPTTGREDGFYDETLKHQGDIHQDSVHTDAEAERIYARLMDFSEGPMPNKPELSAGAAL